MVVGRPAAAPLAAAGRACPTGTTFWFVDHFRGPQSALSPSAYLADLLHLLGQLKLRPARAGRRARTALDLLLERRPDIAQLEHTAANADTPMPYVDLVNEVLEGGFAQPFRLGLEVEPLLDADGAPSPVLRDALANAGMSCRRRRPFGSSTRRWNGKSAIEAGPCASSTGATARRSRTAGGSP